MLIFLFSFSNECESRCLAVSHGTVGEGVTAEEVAVSEAVVGVEGEGRVPAAVTAVLGRDPAAVTAGMVTNTIITLVTFNSLLPIIKKHSNYWPGLEILQAVSLNGTLF